MGGTLSMQLTVILAGGEVNTGGLLSLKEKGAESRSQQNPALQAVLMPAIGCPTVGTGNKDVI